MARVVKQNLDEQIRELITKINTQNRFMLVGIVMGVILVGYYFIFLGGKIKEVTAITAEISSMSEAMSTTENDIHRYAQYQEALKNLQINVEDLNKKIKTSDEIPSLLEHLTRVAAENGLKIEQMMPDTNRAKTILKNKEGKFVSVPVIIGAKSGYHNFGKFLNVIEREGGFSGVQDFGVMTNPDDSNQHLVKVVLQVTTYEKLDKPEKPEKPGGKNKDAD